MVWRNGYAGTADCVGRGYFFRPATPKEILRNGDDLKSTMPKYENPAPLAGHTVLKETMCDAPVA